MNSKMTTNTQLSITESKKQKQKPTKQTTRTGTELQKWRPHGGLLAGRGRMREMPGEPSTPPELRYKGS